MKRTLIIILGIVVVLALIAVWAYLLFWNNPGNNNVFTNLDFDNQEEDIIPPLPEEDEVVVDVISDEQLRQLTTTPVIGFQEVRQHASSTPRVYYVNPGTGHIFAINLSTGEETRVSATTIPTASKALITPDGKFAVFKSGFGSVARHILAELDTFTEEATLTTLTGDVLDFTVTTDNTFLLAIRDSGSASVKEFLPLSGSLKDLFEIPFTEVSFDWGDTSASTHHFYPKANGRLDGYLYEVVGGKINRLPISGKGLTAVSGDNFVLYSMMEEGVYKSYIYNKQAESFSPALAPVLTDKCVYVDVNSSFSCGYGGSRLSGFLPDVWYQGTLITNDNLYKISPFFNSLNFVLDIEATSGRQLDLMNLLSGQGGVNLYFQNKNDQTLWLYENN